MTKDCIHTMSIYKTKQFSVCCHGNYFLTRQQLFLQVLFRSLPPSEPNLSLEALLILELFRIM